MSVIVWMILVGIGTGTFFSLTAVAQNVLPVSHLGVGTAATRYLGQLGATLGIAIVGTVVNSSASHNVMHSLPANQTDRLALAGVLQHGFVAILVFAVVVLFTTFFFKDELFVAPSPSKATVRSQRK